MKVLDLFRLDGRVAVVTGVSSGLGVSFATALAEAGADIMACARREEKLKANAEQISKATGRNVYAVVADVTNEEEVANLFAVAERKFGKVDILVNNAGVGIAKPSVELTGKDWADVTSVDLAGTFFCAREAAKSMMKKNISGSIINIASIYGLFGDIMPAASYYASKGAVVNLTRALAVEWAQYKIRVNAIAPGFFPSEMTAQLKDNQPFLDHIKDRTPLGRMGDPEELKGAAVLLASDAGSYITGHILAVDGGWDAK